MSIRILVTRLDLIGDLIITTPIFAALKQKFPSAKIDILVHTYNYEVIMDNPNINRIFLYKKTSHAYTPLQRIKAIINNISLIPKLNKEKYDYAILCNGGAAKKELRILSKCKIKNMIGYIDEETKHKINMPVSEYQGDDPHEVKAIFHLLSPLGFENTPGRVEIYLNEDIKAWAKNLYNQNFENINKKTIGFQISSRRQSERWSIERWAKLADICAKKYNLNILIFWSPGSDKNKKHPGDDIKATELKNKLQEMNLSFLCFQTKSLRELFAGINLCDYILTSDGGTMHAAAALNKKIIAYIDAKVDAKWHPWCENYQLFKYSISAEKEISMTDLSNALELMINNK